MPISIAELDAHFEKLGYKATRPDNAKQATTHRGLRFTTVNYLNTEKEKSVFLSLFLAPDGDYLEIVAPSAYNVRECRNKGPVFAALLEITFKTRLQNFEYDSADGEVRVATDVVINDGTITCSQLDAMIGGIIRVLERFHGVIAHVIETGKIDMSLQCEPTAGRDVETETADLVAKLGGLDGLRKLVESQGQGQS